MYHLRQLQCALALAEYGHFGKAADAIGITQSGLTQSIARLESHYGVALFDRQRDGVRPTALGEVLLDDARIIIDRLDDTSRRIQLMSELDIGELSIGADPMISAEVLSPVFVELLEAHPQLSLRLRSGPPGELLPALERNELDLYVGFPHHSIGTRFHTTALEFTAPRVVMAPTHPLTESKTPDLLEYLKYPVIQGPIAQWYTSWAEEEFENAGASHALQQHYFLSADNTGPLISMLRSSEAIMAAMYEDVRLALTAGELVEKAPLRWPQHVPGVIVTQRGSALLPAAERLIGGLINRFGVKG
ncbi:LysR family transcriptional regulator [Congregibacter sp.]|uniref:LysR family transcriptional regulator n=1 Tax=Congregibacter sp. TaxID=2744308 RepID=UPI003F6B4E9F